LVLRNNHDAGQVEVERAVSHDAAHADGTIVDNRARVKEGIGEADLDRFRRMRV
jgi:hypothetical protein